VSLIADALKTAQRESAKRGAPSSANTRSTEGFFAYRKTRSDARSTRIVVIAGAGVAGLIALGVVLYARSGTPAKQPAAPPALMMDVAPVPAASVPIVPAPAPDSLGAKSAMFQFEERAGATDSYAPLTLRPLASTTPPPVPEASDRASSTATGSGATAQQPGTGAAAVPQTAQSQAPDSDTSPRPEAARAPAARSGSGSLRITVEGGSTDRATAGLGQQALEAQRRGDVARARQLYERILAQGGATAEVYNNLGALERGAGNLTAAVEQFRNAIALDRAYAPAWSNLGIVHDAMGKRVDATAAFQQALKLDPGNVATKLNLALQYRASGLPDDARRLLDDVVRTAPDFAEGHYALGQVLEDAGDRPGAIRQYELFLKAAGTRLPAASESVRRHLAQLGSAQR
jgi:Tfp pilus assembly protein PilF